VPLAEIVLDSATNLDRRRRDFGSECERENANFVSYLKLDNFVFLNLTKRGNFSTGRAAMTVAVAWVRTIRDCEELVFVTDSRLSGDGCNFDACPKILTLPRNDCLIGFAGYTGHAYPMIHQLALAIDSHAPARRGSLDLSALKSHTLKIFDSLADLITSSPGMSQAVSTAPEANFIFGGYSWVKKRFDLWAIRYLPSQQRFIAEAAKWMCYSAGSDRCKYTLKTNMPGLHPIGRIAFAGDQAKVAKDLLSQRLAHDDHDHQKLDMEPFEVVRDMLRSSNRSETIGGSPQVAKVYQYMNSAPHGVYWPNKDQGVVHLQGRPMLGYERSERWVLDPDTLMSERPELPRTDVDDAPAELASDAECIELVETEDTLE